MLFRRDTSGRSKHTHTRTHARCNARNMFYVNKYNEKPTSIKVLTVFKLLPTRGCMRAHLHTANTLSGVCTLLHNNHLECDAKCVQARKRSRN